MRKTRTVIPIVCKMGCYASPAAILYSPFPTVGLIKKKWRKLGGVSAKFNGEDNDTCLQLAITAASLRFRETHRPDPLFLDLYAGCFLNHLAQENMMQSTILTASSCHYCLATKFIDDKLLDTMNKLDGLRQIILLTDGMDTRPYRLKWPHSIIIFDISPERVFKISSQRLEGVGAKISRTCMFRHVPLESSDILGELRRKGFNGNRPSMWVFQGLPVMKLASFEEILIVVSSLAMKGCVFIGEMPVSLTETEFEPNMQKWMEKLFMRNGFRVDVVSYDEVARNVHQDPPSGDYGSILFLAQQLRLSDDQMESWRIEFQRLDGEGDEEGFEEL